MKEFKKLPIGMLLTFGLLTGTTVYAQADVGVATSDFAVKDKAGNVVMQYKMNQKVSIQKETETAYTITVNDNNYQVEKNNILKTIKQEEQSLRVNADGASLKNTPSLFGNTIENLNKGETVYRIKGMDAQGKWIKVRTTQGVEGWVYNPSFDENYNETPVSTKGYMLGSAEEGYGILDGNEIEIDGFENATYKVKTQGKYIFIPKDFVSFTPPLNQMIHPQPVQTPPQNLTHNDALANRILNEAYKHLGKPYVWGATGPDTFDCSGLVQYVFAKEGVIVPRTTSEQFALGIPIDTNHLQAGDLLFFQTYEPGASHVGIYIKDNKFINAVGERVTISDLQAPYFATRYLGAKRMF
ncbi:SH3 domain-containing C40 family peptidase (plasmid) [Aneurinibacillus sp. Ricciae_BoGa-3]|uniref:C40 family peptidase n=1 Tax=Aneurinibacillus sp. Ricciae_BoGa-3 TaxID=3022697 RepID=UPI00233FF8FD|nr:SH3 domain-containing C40 family peptidase [Aneurinibacillus sp. Ricciae_BoGa-3]WCK56940.1 SH3 domain-containing C40 family peptidase [Aneurinibacillus sp. Ricciae_BoGa-3]WCK57763.1 SH3 domain-containing C40 family peptidase [Aneurinibacillus sp. Ricciae_BoGa-3]